MNLSREEFTKILHERVPAMARKSAIFCGAAIDLYKLGELVCANGGTDKLSETRQWGIIGRGLKLKPAAVKKSAKLKRLYETYVAKCFDADVVSVSDAVSNVVPLVSTLLCNIGQIYVCSTNIQNICLPQKPVMNNLPSHSYFCFFLHTIF